MKYLNLSTFFQTPIKQKNQKKTNIFKPKHLDKNKKMARIPPNQYTEIRDLKRVLRKGTEEERIQLLQGYVQRVAYNIQPSQQPFIEHELISYLDKTLRELGLVSEAVGLRALVEESATQGVIEISGPLEQAFSEAYHS